MGQIKVWHCYFHGHRDTMILLAESHDALKAKVRGIIVSEWDLEDHGPMPEDFDDLIEAFHENNDSQYFGEWDWAYVNPDLCETDEGLV